MKKYQSGFSLIEVLVALVVVGIGMSAALSATNSNVEVLTHVERTTYANWVAENVLAEIKLEGIVNTGELLGESRMAGKTWYWQADIMPTFDADVLQVKLKVSINENMELLDADVTGYLKSEVSS